MHAAILKKGIVVKSVFFLLFLFPLCIAMETPFEPVLAEEQKWLDCLNIESLSSPEIPPAEEKLESMPVHRPDPHVVAQLLEQIESGTPKHQPDPNRVASLLAQIEQGNQVPKPDYKKVAALLKKLEHQDDSDLENNFKCLLCDTMYESRSGVYKHLRQHHKLSTDVGFCDYKGCNIFFYELWKRLEHMKQRHKEGWQCLECPHAAKNSSALERHYRYHKGSHAGFFRCKFPGCSVKCSRYYDRSEHILIAHAKFIKHSTQSSQW